MNTLERLQAIRAKCVELLKIAEKRTPGEWDNQCDDDSLYDLIGPLNKIGMVCPVVTKLHSEADAFFIASCAGPAEAGWRTTTIVINVLLKISQVRNLTFEESYMAEEIIDEWKDTI